MEKRKSKIDTGLTHKVTDPRPLKDKEFQSKSLKAMIKLLIKKNYNNPISLAVCLQGDMQTFKEIADFLIKQVDENLGFESEKELIDLLKAINYPYPLHSHYFSGALNYWPYLIGILDWLVKVVNAFELESEADIYSDYFLKAYQHFMCDQSYDELRFLFEEKLNKYCIDIEKKIEATLSEMKEMRKSKKDLRINKVPEYDSKLNQLKEEIDAELRVNEGVFNELKLFEANYDDFKNNILAILPDGIPTVEQVQEKIENDEKCNREIMRIMIELEEIKLEEPQVDYLLNEDNEEDNEYICESEELQEEIDNCRREYSYIVEEYEQLDEKINFLHKSISSQTSSTSASESQASSALKKSLLSILQHTDTIKSLFQSTP